MKSLRFLAVPALALLLAACGGPSEGDVENAVRAAIEEAHQKQIDTVKAMGALMGGQTAATIEKEIAQSGSALDGIDIEVGDITENADGTYTAIITVSHDGESESDKVQLMETKSGWVIAD